MVLGEGLPHGRARSGVERADPAGRAGISRRLLARRGLFLRCLAGFGRILSGCDVLVVNRQPDAYAHYGFPTKLTEYLASGAPVISTAATDIPKYLEHGKQVWLIELR